MEGTSGRAKRYLFGFSCAAVVLVMAVWVSALGGCGSVQTSPGGTGSEGGDDVALFPGEMDPAKTLGRSTMSDATEKALLYTNGEWHDDSVPVGNWERHRFRTKAGYTYVVELVLTNDIHDDPDLFLSRDQDPYNNAWHGSMRHAPYSDTIVFRARRDGLMYVAVNGWEGGNDAVVDYAICIRERANPRLEPMLPVLGGV